MVGNAAELNLATKLANDINGVKGVKNRRTIELSESETKEMYDHYRLVW